ncbi:MAG: gluconokinase [Chloroflexi bacterium]|nr:gluconokinase [Chloroflexota bacterium]
MAASSEGVVLALDVGTSSCRASLYDVEAQPAGDHVAQITYAPHLTADGGAELDASALLDNLCAVVDQTQRALRQPVLAVGASTFWHSLLGVDASGAPVTPLYLWLDSRARGEMAALHDQLDEREVHARTGCVLHWTYWPARLRWLRRTLPDVFKRVARWISFGEFVQERLTGAKTVSRSMASGTGLLDVHTGEWYAPLLEFLDLEPEKLGSLAALNEGSTASRWPALKSVLWLPAVGDGACSNIGAGCASPEYFALMIGTSGAERAVWSPPADFSIPWGLWCYRVDEQRVVMGGALNDGGSLMDWLGHTLRFADVHQAEAEVGDIEPDSHGLTVLPLWGGERNPGWADDARGAVVGLRLGTSPEMILRACLEAVALRFATIDGLLQQALPSAGEVIATGGALLHSKTWMQIMADALGRPILASAGAEASSRGAAILALEAIGAAPANNQPSTTERFDPVPDHTRRYRAAADRQRRLYDALVSND